MTQSHEHEYDFIVQETDLDTFGHVNHANYLKIFEQARWDWISAGGFGLKKIQELQIGPTILEVNIKYKRELTVREHIKIISRCPPYNGKIAKVYQTMKNARDEICSEIELTIALFDMQKRKLISAIPEWLEAVQSKKT
jgi:thioesterase-3